MIQAKHLGAWWLLLLLILTPVTVCDAAAPSLVGIWQGSAPEAGPGYCTNKDITLTITKQCGNLFRGKATIGTTYTSNIVGSIKNGTAIFIHGSQDIYLFIIIGEYQSGSPAKINVTYFYTGDSNNTEYDTFSATYAGEIKKALMGIFHLLMLE